MCPDLNHFTHPRGRVPAEDIARQLRELPAEMPPPYGWEEFKRRSRLRVGRKRSVVQWPHAAAAAGVTAVVAAMAVLGARGYMHAKLDDPAPSAALDVNPAAATLEGGRASNVKHIQQTREWLARHPEPAIVQVGPRMVVATLEDRIAWLDDTLTDERVRGVSASQVQLLQQERARLVSSLAQVRYAETLAADGS